VGRPQANFAFLRAPKQASQFVIGESLNGRSDKVRPMSLEDHGNWGLDVLSS